MISGSGGGGASFDDSTLKTEDDFYIHALRRDSDGMLRYTKVRSTDSGVVGDFHRNDGTQYPDFLEGIDYVEKLPNLNHTPITLLINTSSSDLILEEFPISSMTMDILLPELVAHMIIQPKDLSKELNKNGRF